MMDDREALAALCKAIDAVQAVANELKTNEHFLLASAINRGLRALTGEVDPWFAHQLKVEIRAEASK